MFLIGLLVACNDGGESSLINGGDLYVAILAPVDDEGAWQLKVELSNAGHTAVEPYSGDLIYINVSEAVCP